MLGITLASMFLFAMMSSSEPVAPVSIAVGCNANPAARSAELVTAVQNAVNAGGAQLVTLSSGCVYTLTQVNNGVLTSTNGLPVISNSVDLTIQGNGATLSRDSSAPQFRFFEVEQGGRLTLQNMTITGGHAGDNTNASGNTAGGDGGAILNKGVLSGSFVTFTNNIAGAGGLCASNLDGAGGRGGAIASFAQTNLSNSVLEGNRSGDYVDISKYAAYFLKARGGAIFSQESLSLDGVSAKANPIGELIIAHSPPDGTCVVASPLPHDDIASPTHFAAIHHSGSITITNSSFHDEQDVAIAEEYPPSEYGLVVKDSLFYNNGRGIYIIEQGSYATSTHRLESSTFVSNEIGIDIRSNYDELGLKIVNSTFAKNDYGVVGQGKATGDMPRGAVLMAQVNSSTFYLNRCSIGAGYAHETSAAHVIVKNSVMSNNVDTQDCERPTWHQTNWLPVIDDGYNIADHFPWKFGNTAISVTTSVSNVNPMLDLLGAKDNGGKTPTVALLPGSPAINFIPAGACADVPADQRGVVRPQGGRCDAGAYESLSYPRVFMPLLAR